MRLPFILACGLLAGPALAQAPASIDAFIADLNRALQTTGSARLASLVAPDADYRIGECLLAVGPAALAEALRDPPFSERSAPQITRVFVHLLGPDTALVDARQVRYGSQILRQSVPVLLILQRASGVWRIHSWRIPVTTSFPNLRNGLPIMPNSA